MYPENNSKIGVEFDQERVTESARAYVVEKKKRSFLVKFLINRGIVKEEDTAAWILFGFSFLFLVVAISIFFYSIRTKPINLVTAARDVPGQDIKNR